MRRPSAKPRVRATPRDAERAPAAVTASASADPEDDDEPGPRPAEKNYITRAGHRRLTQEFDFLRSKKRPEVVSALSDAAAEGDRSENAEYIYRKKQLREVDRRLRFLAKRLDIAVIVDPSEQKRRDRVFFGATVKVENDDGETAIYRIVGADETGPVGDISWRSPVGRALLGKALGDTVSVTWHAGMRELTIAEIDYL
jgi:transcription elongation factor GreB